MGADVVRACSEMCMARARRSAACTVCGDDAASASWPSGCVPAGPGGLRPGRAGIVGLSWWWVGLDARRGCGCGRRVGGRTSPAPLVWHRWDRRMIAAGPCASPTLAAHLGRPRRTGCPRSGPPSCWGRLAVAAAVRSPALAAGVAAFLVVAAAVHAGCCSSWRAAGRCRPGRDGARGQRPAAGRGGREGVRTGPASGFVPWGERLARCCSRPCRRCFAGPAYVSRRSRHRYAYELVAGSWWAGDAGRRRHGSPSRRTSRCGGRSPRRRRRAAGRGHRLPPVALAATSGWRRTRWRARIASWSGRLVETRGRAARS
jgi:hypothetical protein